MSHLYRVTSILCHVYTVSHLYRVRSIPCHIYTVSSLYCVTSIPCHIYTVSHLYRVTSILCHIYTVSQMQLLSRTLQFPLRNPLCTFTIQKPNCRCICESRTSLTLQWHAIWLEMICNAFALALQGCQMVIQIHCRITVWSTIRRIIVWSTTHRITVWCITKIKIR